MAKLQSALSAPKTSNAGAVAARLGFKYQDHVAAQFALAMIDNPKLTAVECETKDDVTLVWKTETKNINEYVQVKTTDGDKKYSLKEITDRKKPNTPTSLIEKSLLCDTENVSAQFRIVSQRDVNKALAELKLPLDKRPGSSTIDALAKKIGRKWRTVSARGHNLEYWARNAVWQVAADMDSLEARNEKYLSSLADKQGVTPTHGHVHKIYHALLAKMEEAASASKLTDAAKKTVFRTAILEWWAQQLSDAEAVRRSTAKPYKVATEAFFADLHFISEEQILRALTGLDARFENKQWRSQQLAEYLAEWIPEVTLKPSELASVTHSNMKRKLREALDEVERNSAVAPETFMAEMLLHCVVRHYFKSEPIACKLFYQTGSGVKSFKSAHIVHSPKGDELWLGCATVTTLTDHKGIVEKITSDLAMIMDPEFLKKERQAILALREPLHLLPTTLENALAHNSPTDDLLAAIRIPLLIGYDSGVLASGYAADYKQKLVAEIEASYAEIKALLPTSVATVGIHVFLIPVECVKTLTQQFSAVIHAH